MAAKIHNLSKEGYDTIVSHERDLLKSTFLAMGFCFSVSGLALYFFAWRPFVQWMAGL